jgi:hypothetical protein
MNVHPKRTTRLGPFPMLFSNENTAMGVPLHTHYSEVSLLYSIDGEAGFPVFDGTIGLVKGELERFSQEPFIGRRNEDVLVALYEHFEKWTHPEVARWGGAFRLLAVELSVKGIRDHHGHAEGFATYRLEA